MFYRFLLVAFLLTGCCAQYQRVEPCPFLVVCVNARQLDYSDGRQALATIARHPSDGSKNGDVGHAWIYLQGPEGVFEGGHSGDLGFNKPRYFDGVMDLCEISDLNPVRYLWTDLGDGFFQEGPGKHRATLAAKIDLTIDQYQTILAYIRDYDFTSYSLTCHQCTDFVIGTLKIAGFNASYRASLPLPSVITLCGEELRLWNDSCYSCLEFSSPDVLEASLKRAINDGKADDVTHWYRCRKGCGKSLGDTLDDLWRLPSRTLRAWSYRISG